jgi:hypothetical protein
LWVFIANELLASPGKSTGVEIPDNYFTSLPMLKFHLGEQNFLGQNLSAFYMGKR